MPLVYQQNINEATRLGVWHITEDEHFFLQQVPVQREISHPNKRLQHLAGRLLLKKLYPAFPYELIRIADTLKPFLANEAYHFSISHCGNYAAAIVSKKDRVGVDIEFFNPKVENILHKFLAPAELDMFQQITNFQFTNFESELFVLAWCVKETIYKWYGDGGIDFSKHIKIENVLFTKALQGTCECRFLKGSKKLLLVHFIFFEKNCLSWVCSG